MGFLYMYSFSKDYLCDNTYGIQINPIFVGVNSTVLIQKNTNELIKNIISNSLAQYLHILEL
jgi:hypothetical protein